MHATRQIQKIKLNRIRKIHLCLEETIPFDMPLPNRDNSHFNDMAIAYKLNFTIFVVFGLSITYFNTLTQILRLLMAVGRRFSLGLFNDHKRFI